MVGPNSPSRFSNLDRRSFIKAGVLAAVAMPALLEAAANPAFSDLNERSLAFYNLHTGESLKAVYWERGEYVAPALADINRVLRDHRTGDKHQIDQGLLDLLCDLRFRLDTTEPLQI